jgi:hypothetical protein
MRTNTATGQGDEELIMFGHFVRQFSSIPHSEFPDDLWFKITDMIMRCRQNGSLSLISAQILCALLRVDPAACEAVFVPTFLMFCLEWAVRTNVPIAQWLIRAVTIGLRSELFAPALLSFSVDGDLWLSILTQRVLTELSASFSVRPFLEFLATFARNACPDVELLAICLSEMSQFIRASYFNESTREKHLGLAAQVVIFLIECPTFRVDFLRDFGYQYLISFTFFDDQLLPCWSTLLSRLSLRHGVDMSEFLQLQPNAFVKQILDASGDRLRFLAHTLAQLLDRRGTVAIGDDGPPLVNWLVAHVADQEFGTKKQMLLCLFALAVADGNVLAIVVDAECTAWDEV